MVGVRLLRSIDTSRWHRFKMTVWVFVSRSVGNYFVVTPAVMTAVMAHTHWENFLMWHVTMLSYLCLRQDILVLTSAEPEEVWGDPSSLVDSPLHTVVFIKSWQGRWRFSVREKSVSLQTERARTSQRSGTVCLRSAAEPHWRLLSFCGIYSLWIFTSLVSHGVIVCDCITKPHYLKICFRVAHPVQSRSKDST